MSIVSIAGLSKANVLAALYNAAKPQGMGFLHYDPKPMTTEQAEVILRQNTYFDYLKGRVMKVDLGKDDVNVRDYDRDNGAGTAQRVIDTLRESGNPNAAFMKKTHHTNTVAAAVDVEQRLNGETTIHTSGGIASVNLGLSDVKHVLQPAIRRAVVDGN